MPALDWCDWFDGHVISIKKTMRPYLKQSIHLVNATRSIQQFQSASADSDSDLELTIKCVSKALKAATDPAVRQRRSDSVDEDFKKANQEVHRYCEKYKIKPIPTEDVAKEDEQATKHLHAAKRIAAKAAKLIESKASMKLLVTFWVPDSEKQRTLEFMVENGIKLDHFLARILQKSLDQKNGLPSVNLIQNPGFFTRIPLTRKDFSEWNQDSKRLKRPGHKHQSKLTRLCQLDLREDINTDDQRHGLHLLMDPHTLPESRLIIFDNERRKDIKRNYRNVWKLKEQDTYAAAREISGCLVCLDPKSLPAPRPEPPPPPLREPTRETPVALPPKDPIHPSKPPVKAGLFSQARALAASLLTDPSPPKPGSTSPDPGPLPTAYVSRNAMTTKRLQMVHDSKPKKGWLNWGRS